MKSDVLNLGVQLDQQNLKQLLHETKETLASDIHTESHRRFGPVDLWNQEKKYRSTLDRRRWLN